MKDDNGAGADRLNRIAKGAGMKEQTDRGLLELAAKAAGLRVKTWEGHTGTMCAIDDDRHGVMWNPLADDGDALRLAVKLGIYVQPFTESARPSVFCRGMSHIGMECIEHFDKHDENAAAATRRAITRTAAEIGKAMQ